MSYPAAPVLIWSETNGGGPTIAQATTTDDIGGIQFANIDAPSTQFGSGISANHQVPAGQNSFEKWLRLKLQSTAPNTLSGFQIYFSNTASLDSAHGANVVLNYGLALAANYTTPTNAASAVATIPVLNAHGLAEAQPYIGPTNVVGNYGEFIVLQALVLGAAAQGSALVPQDLLAAAYSWS